MADPIVVRVGIVQRERPRSGDAARAAVAFLRETSAAGADVTVFPELWSTGFTLPDPQEAGSASFRAAALLAERDLLHDVGAAARELGTAAVITHLGVVGERLTNAASLIGPDGTVWARYDKVHLARFAGEQGFAPGSGFAVADLPLSGRGTVRVGLMICYDRTFPEAGRVLADLGAELVLVPNAGPLCGNRTAQVRTRSFENQFAIAVANYTDPPMSGHSLVCDGVAFTSDGAPRDLVVWSGDDQPASPVVPVALEQLRSYRAAQPWGLADRVPSAYRARPDPPSLAEYR